MNNIEILRHSTAHLLAHAVKELFPQTQIAIGPVIADGFYYDFSYKDSAFTSEDLPLIEAKMHEIAKRQLPIERLEWTRAQAIAYFTGRQELYKVQIIENISVQEVLSLYKQGDFIDLCRGPHVDNTGKLKIFKLTKLAGAYWRGDAKNEMLQRIYGTAFNTQQELDAYLIKIEEAKKRDHRKIGKELGLFHIQEEAPGMIFWHPRGFTLYHIIEDYMRSIFATHGYQEVKTPQIVARSLWEQSGHWEKFFNEMYTTEIEERQFAIKPMNCPGHVQIFKQTLRSYKDLPLRLAEFGVCHRKEPSGSLHGLMRVRGFVQDDAHIFCTREQIATEVIAFHELAFKVYQHFGFTDISVKLSTRPEERVGSDALWDEAETILQNLLQKSGVEWSLQPGEGAFYGPKVEYAFKDGIDRVWQLGTLQLDFATPARLGAEYVAADGNKYPPVMLHRAILGSLERFIGILCEHYAGKFPVWLAPVQAIIMNITNKQDTYCINSYQQLQRQGVRVSLDLRNEKINFKIREHTLHKIPYLIVVGDREMADNTLAVRKLDGQNLGAMSLSDLVSLIRHSNFS